MPRQPRLVLPHVAVHLIQRGNNRCACFVADSDRQLYLLHLSELSKKFMCAVHAYRLMPNTWLWAHIPPRDLPLTKAFSSTRSSHRFWTAFEMRPMAATPSAANRSSRHFSRL